MRHVAGNGDACVKAYLGPLPEGETGYNFVTSVHPTRYRNFWGEAGAVWELGTDGVFEVVSDLNYVGITVEVIDGSDVD